MQFSLVVTLLLLIPVALLVGLAAWVQHPAPLDVHITVEPFSLPPHGGPDAPNLSPPLMEKAKKSNLTARLS